MAGLKKYGFISDEYRTLNMKHHIKKHDDGRPWGNDGKIHKDIVHAFCHRLGAKTILDYGCGNGSLKRSMEEAWPNRYDIREFDPCIIGKCEKRPDKADVVVCTDVIEHVEQQYLNPLLYELYNRCLKGAYLVIATREANEHLPDGSNAHRVVRSGEWWVNKLTEMKFPIANVDIVPDKKVTIWLEKPQPKT